MPKLRSKKGWQEGEVPVTQEVPVIENRALFWGRRKRDKGIRDMVAAFQP